MSRASEKSSNGPDWVDIRAFMMDLQKLHECAIYLELMPGTTQLGPEMRCVLTAVSNAPGSDLRACEESVARSWPNKDSKTMEGTTYYMCVKLDAILLDRWWKQGKLELP